MSDKRVLTLKSNDSTSGDAVVYVMARDQRVRDNHALLLAQAEAIEANIPLVVLFNIYSKSGVRSREHHDFMLTGLKVVKKDLENKNIPFVFRTGDAKQSTLDVLKKVNARSVYFDFSPLRGPRKLAKDISKEFDGNAYVVDTHNIIPVWTTSDKQEFAAHTIRRKIHKLLEEYVSEPGELKKHPCDLKSSLKSATIAEVEGVIGKIQASGIKVDRKSGEEAGRNALSSFIRSGLEAYANGRNDIATDQQSGFSPYLHYGQLSSLRIVLNVMKAVDEPPLLFKQAKMAQPGGSSHKADGMNALFEEMIVRKELSDNFCFYNENYDSIKGGPKWGLESLAQHEDDDREFTYTKKQWENAETHDELWNATQMQLRNKGNIHGYMRMYWAKKILQWSSSPRHAVEIAVYLNDHYSIDGGDPNGYVGILWSITGLHDRPWFERSIFGKVRYMSSNGISKKYDTDAYITEELNVE